MFSNSNQNPKKTNDSKIERLERNQKELNDEFEEELNKTDDLKICINVNYELPAAKKTNRATNSLTEETKLSTIIMGSRYNRNLQE